MLGAGCIGLMIVEAAGRRQRHLCNRPVPVAAGHGRGVWRHPDQFQGTGSVQFIKEATNGRGVDVAIEAAWADHSVQQAADMARLGGRLVLVGIPGNDRLEMKHSTARRKGLTVRLARRMKHVYPRAIGGNEWARPAQYADLPPVPVG